ncbi:hypothetical protein B1H42_14730 [Enterobacter cloacae subsp. cloacae]|nr:hypothetical protein B1H42_14730 [Enterobacter cloacae subsp. cloacae]ORC33393.1 hypothetical protein B2M05_01970 [Enterobacter cloacae subsp. cloacae]PCM83226.1 hypothetical protein CP903_06010 [Enterobacter cloacae]
MLAFFMSGGGKAWNRLHLTLYTPLSEKSLCMIGFLLLLHFLSVKSEIHANAMRITSFTSIFSKLY